jgi:hypothetical protein
MSAETDGNARLSLAPDALSKLWRSLWRDYQSREKDVEHAYDDSDRYGCKVAAGAAGFCLDLVHDAFTPGRGWCTVDCNHVRAGLSAEKLAAVLAQIDHHLARTEEKSKSSCVGPDGRAENMALASLRMRILAAATTP